MINIDHGTITKLQKSGGESNIEDEKEDDQCYKCWRSNELVAEPFFDRNKYTWVFGLRILRTPRKNLRN